jgi:O-antigen/teichoic acid export membrane protein
MLYYRIDVLILSSVKGDVVVGNYNAARSLLLGLVIFPSGVMSAFLPMSSRLLKLDLAKFRNAGLQLFQFMSFIGGAIAVGGWLLSSQVIFLLFGQKYGLAAAPLKILLWAFFFMCLNNLQGTILIVLGLQHLQTYAVAFAALLNLILNLVVIPHWGADGAALTAVATEALVFGLAGLFIRKYFSLRVMLRALWKVGVGVAASVPAIFLSRNFNFSGGTWIPLIVFTLTVWLLGGFSWQKVRDALLRTDNTITIAR